MAESDSDAELSAQYLTGANARRRSRAPAANTALPKQPHAAPASIPPCKVSNAVNGGTQYGSVQPNAVPDAACVSFAPGNAKLVHSLKEMRRERHMLDIARMSTQDPFQDLAEQTFHQNLKLAEAGSSGCSQTAPGDAAAAAESAGSHHATNYSNRKNAAAGLKNCSTGEPLKHCRVLDAREQISFHERS